MGSADADVVQPSVGEVGDPESVGASGEKLRSTRSCGFSVRGSLMERLTWSGRDRRQSQNWTGNPVGPWPLALAGYGLVRRAGLFCGVGFAGGRISFSLKDGIAA